MKVVKKAFSVAMQVLSLLITLFAVFMMIFTILSAGFFGKTDGRGLLGLKFFTVLSNSMKEDFQAGDMVISKVPDLAALKQGDIITFQSIDPLNYGEVVTHKIREETVYEGKRAFITYGTATGAPDTVPVPEDRVVGKYVAALPKMGFFLQFLKTTPGYITLIFMPFLLLILWQGVKFYRTVQQYKKLQQNELETQKAALEEDRRKAREMLEELEELRGKLLPAQGAEAGPAPGGAPREQDTEDESAARDSAPPDVIQQNTPARNDLPQDTAESA